MLIFQWESEFWGSKGDKSNVEGLGEQWDRQPQGQGWVHFFHIFASCIVQLDLWNGFCHPCNLKIRIFIEKLAYKHVSHAYLKKIYYYFPVLVPWNSILYCIIWGGVRKRIYICIYLEWISYTFQYIYIDNENTYTWYILIHNIQRHTVHNISYTYKDIYL